MATHDTSSWAEYSRLVLAQLDQNTNAIKELGAAMHMLRSDMSVHMGGLRLQAVQELSALEARIGHVAREDIVRVRDHIDEELAITQRDFDKKLAGLSAKLDQSTGDISATMRTFVRDVSEKVNTLNTAVAGLQIKAGIWGAGGSILGVLSVWLISQLPKLVR